MKKKRKFPRDVARFFNPQKSGTNANGTFRPLGTHQLEKAKERSYIPVAVMNPSIRFAKRH